MNEARACYFTLFISYKVADLNELHTTHLIVRSNYFYRIRFMSEIKAIE